MSVPSLTEFLQMLIAGGVTGYIVQFLAEKSAWFQKLGANTKLAIVFALSMLLPLMGQVIALNVPSDVMAMIEPYYNALAAGFIVFLASQGWHKLK